jgi:hypothetical protein
VRFAKVELSQIAHVSTLRLRLRLSALQLVSFLFLLKADLSSLDVPLAVFYGAIRLSSAARIKPPDLSGGPLGCFSVFCVPGPAPWTAKAVAGVLLPMLGVRADPPEIHGREIHGRSQLAPDLATWIKLALLHLR